MEVYLDNSATTRVFPEVAELVTQIMCEDYGNPSSLHLKGVQAERHIRNAKDTISRLLKADEQEICFTSGGTEADNLALIGCAMANYRAGRHLITTQIEHPAVLQPMHYLEDQGFSVTYLPVDKKGMISLNELRRAIRQDTILVSIMHTNNEIGTVQPIAEAGELIKSSNPNTLFHVDAVQGFGKYRIYPKRMGIDLLSVSGHKIHAPKGTGFLYVGRKVKIHNIIYGGGQQKNLRSGTENVAGIAGMAKAAKMLYADLDRDTEKLYALKAYFTEELRKIGNIQINGFTGGEGAPHIVSATVRGVRSEVLLHALEDKGIYVSAGSACSSNKPHTGASATLKGIGLDKELADSTIRFSMSVFTTKEELDYTLQVMYDIIPLLRKYTRNA
ncbi:MAG: cysteine desulfurase [Lachnospiraceae bacterium]|nr:cysteine desulfurase [Lachnospiraceae bacterium]